MSSHHDQIQHLAEKLEEWDYKLDRLEHRILDLPAALKKKTHDRIEKIKAQRGKMHKRKVALQEGAEHLIHDAEESVELAVDSVKFLFEEIELDIDIDKEV